MSIPFMFGRDRLTIEPGFNPWDVIGPTNPVITPTETGPKTVTGTTRFVDPATNDLFERTEYSDGTYTDRRLSFDGGGGAGGGGGPTQTSPEQDLIKYNEQQNRQSAFEVLKQRFQGYGLTSLATEIEKIFKGEGKTRAGTSIPIPTSETGFYLALIETPAYYERFGKVNEARVKSGYTALDERTILGMEDQYQKTMKAYNMPKGFYDTPEDFQTFISNDLSELELADRLQASRQFAQVVDPTVKSQLKNLYNIDENMLAAYVADPEKGQNLLNNLAGKSLTAAASILSGLTQQAAEAATGLGAGEMRFGEQLQRFGAAQTIAERGAFLSQIEKQQQQFGEKEAVDVAFGGLEQSRQAAEKLASRERARFAGTAGTTTTSLGRSAQGQI